MRRVALSEICLIVQGGRSGLSGNDFVEEGYQAFGAGGMNGYLSTFEFDVPGIVLSSIGARCGKCFLADGKWSGLANTQLIFPDPSVADIRFLWFQLNDESRWPRAGTGQPFIKPSDVKAHGVTLPPLAEQRRIADLLDQADALRRKRRTALGLLDELLRSTFLEMFGDPVTNPKGWPVVALSELGELDRGRSRHRPRNDPSLLGGPHPFIQTGDVANARGIIRIYTATYSEKGLLQSRKWPAGTLCITIAANIAQTGILAFEACFPDSVVGFKPHEKTTCEYIQGVMAFLQPMIEATAPQVAQRNINLAILGDVRIPLPPLKNQQIFGEAVTSLRKSELLNDTAAEATESLFQSLLHRAFQGQL